jgi:hypothetical protein
VLTALFTENAAGLPIEYAEYQACRLYGCTPSELYEQDEETVRLHLAFAAAEQKVEQQRIEQASKGRGGGAGT